MAIFIVEENKKLKDRVNLLEEDNKLLTEKVLILKEIIEKNNITMEIEPIVSRYMWNKVNGNK